MVKQTINELPDIHFTMDLDLPNPPSPTEAVVYAKTYEDILELLKDERVTLITHQFKLTDEQYEESQSLAGERQVLIIRKDVKELSVDNHAQLRNTFNAPHGDVSVLVTLNYDVGSILDDRSIACMNFTYRSIFIFIMNDELLNKGFMIAEYKNSI